jgi:hypothetical protein
MRDRRKLRGVVVSATLLISGLAVRAEVSTDPGQGGLQVLVMAFNTTDDPDPIGLMWQPFRAIPPESMLNPSGYVRGDGRPDLAFKTGSEDPDGVPVSPVVVWAYNAGGDRDIAIAEWGQTAWGAIEFLTAGAEDDLDPRIFIEEDGTTHVVWWTGGAVDRVFLVTRLAASSVWTAPLELVAGGRRPSVAVFEGALRVAFERDSAVPGMAQDVVIFRREAAGSFVEELSTPTARTEPLDAKLHSRAGKLWLDWKQGEQVFGCTEYEGAWGAVEQPVWPDPSWVGVEETRRTIESQVLH